MVGVTYLAVPLYRMFCQATGFGGTVQRRETIEEKVVRQRGANGTPATSQAARELTIHFNADVSDGLQWKFTPCQRELRLRPGEPALAFYTAHNLSDTPVTGVSTYNVSPMKAGAYFNKIQCFCFEEQRLRANEKIDMPVFFYIDPDMLEDGRMDDVDTITLSYTFFRANDAGAPLPLPPPSLPSTPLATARA